MSQSTTPTAADRQPSGPRAAFLLAGLLLLGAIVVALGASVGVARTFDGSTPGRATGAAWVVLLPAILALVVVLRRPLLGAAVSAGVGIVAIARLLGDLALLTDSNGAIRPELFYERSDAALPFRSAGGAFLVVLGDVLMVAAGVLAAARLGNRFAPRAQPIFEPRTAEILPDPGPELLAEALESAELSDSPRSRELERDGRPTRNNWLIFVGFVAAVILLAASLALPYSGGYLVDRYVPAGIDLWGVAAALALWIIGVMAVLVSAVLPRQVAVAVLGGVGAGAAVPLLTAIAVRLENVPLQLNFVVALGLVGAALLPVAGLLAHTKLTPTNDDEPSARSIRWTNLAGAILTLLVAGAAAVGWQGAALTYNGGPDPALSSGFSTSAPLHLPFVVPMVICLLGGALWLVPVSAPVGRAISSIGWVSLLVPVTQSLYLLGELQASATVPNIGFSAPRWTLGVGSWCGLAGTVLGVAVLILAVSAGRQSAQATQLIADEDSLAKFRTVGTWTAVLLTVLTALALALPIYRTASGTSPTALVGFALNSWGVLALAIGMLCAAWAATRARSAAGAAAYALSGGAILMTRLLIPDAVRAQDGFTVEFGLYLGYVTIAAFAAGAVVLALAARRVRMVDPRPLAGTGGQRRGKSSTTKTKGRQR